MVEEEEEGERQVGLGRQEKDAMPWFFLESQERERKREEREAVESRSGMDVGEPPPRTGKRDQL